MAGAFANTLTSVRLPLASVSPAALMAATPTFVAWTVVAAMVMVVASLKAVRVPLPARPQLPRRPSVVDVVLERGAIDAQPVLWLKLADGRDERLMRVLVTERDVTIETDLTNPPSVRRYNAPTAVGTLANRMVWAAAGRGSKTPDAREAANQLVTLLAIDDERSVPARSFLD